MKTALLVIDMQNDYLWENRKKLFSYGEEESRRYSFKVNFDKLVKDQTYYGLDKLSLNSLFCDNTWMKDMISYRLFRDAGVEAPLVSYVWLTVNGTDQGLYMAVEDVNEGFLNRVYRGKGVIYSVERRIDTSNITRESMDWIRENGFPPATDVHGADLLYTGEDLANYADILGNVDTKANPSDPGRIVSAIRALSREENVDDFFDMDEIIRFFAVHNYLLNFDSYTGSQLSNLKLHEQDGRLSLIPWDYNLAFGTFPSVIGFENWEDPTRLINLGIDTPLIHAEEDNRPLWKLIRSHPEYLSTYHEVLNTLLSDHLLNGEYEAEIDRVSEMLLPWVEKDPTAFCTVDEFQTAPSRLRRFCCSPRSGRFGPTTGYDLLRHTVDLATTAFLLFDADVALYYVKDHGRHGCCFYEPEMRDKPEGRD